MKDDQRTQTPDQTINWTTLHFANHCKVGRSQLKNTEKGDLIIQPCEIRFALQYALGMKYGQRPRTPDQTIKRFSHKWTAFYLANHCKVGRSQLKNNEVGDLTIQPCAIRFAWALSRSDALFEAVEP